MPGKLDEAEPILRRVLITAPLIGQVKSILAVDEAANWIYFNAEKDNVYVKLTSPEVKRFTIEAVHPNYVGTIVVDRSAFDLHNCPDLAAAPIITEKPQRYTIFETPDLQLVGLTIPNFWRKTVVPVRVGDKVETKGDLEYVDGKLNFRIVRPSRVWGFSADE
jgi:hypothetical protein